MPAIPLHVGFVNPGTLKNTVNLSREQLEHHTVQSARPDA
jgi:hypothetical protein